MIHHDLFVYHDIIGADATESYMSAIEA
jgi:hypothetical protein